mmetsp:Transcript_1537/g.1044  ORF Transcript_1537/g.1044 Transcript_1537/m.1044 type:complete len:243 (-) Transcript_1537:158-886(-)
MDALCCVPNIISDNVLDSERVFLRQGRFSLSKVFGFSEHVLRNCLLVFHSLLDNDRFREPTFESFIMDRHGRSIEHLLLPISKSVLRLVHRPVVLPIPLLPRRKVAMRLVVHAGNVAFFLFVAANWVHDLLGVLGANGRHPKGKLLLLRLFWPVISSLEPRPQRLLHLRCILILFDIVKLVGETGQVLGSNDLVHVVGAESLLTVGVLLWNLWSVVHHTWVHLLHPWLVLETLPVLLEMFWG